MIHYWFSLPWYINDPFTMIHYYSLHHDTLPVPFTMIYYWSPLPWYTTGPLYHDTLLVPLPWYTNGPFTMIHYWSFYHDTLLIPLPWYTTCPLYHDTLLVPFTMIHYWCHDLKNFFSEFCSDRNGISPSLVYG